PPETYTPSLHDALPISQEDGLHDLEIRRRIGAFLGSGEDAVAWSKLLDQLVAVRGQQRRSRGEAGVQLLGQGKRRHGRRPSHRLDRKSTRLNSSHLGIS